MVQSGEDGPVPRSSHFSSERVWLTHRVLRLPTVHGRGSASPLLGNATATLPTAYSYWTQWRWSHIWIRVKLKITANSAQAIAEAYPILKNWNPFWKM